MVQPLTINLQIVALEIPIVIAATGILLTTIYLRRQIGRWLSFAFLSAYSTYCAMLFL